jgi:DNA-binding transcriptional ArsR family regulator
VAEKTGERQVNDVATLKALADPTRLAIMGALMGSAGEPQTVKEIAAALGEPQTKLYRHVKQLEQAGLIAVAGTRLVSGIVESRYTAAQDSLRLSRELFAVDSAARTDALDAVLATVDRAHSDFRSQVLAGRVDFSAPEDGSAGLPAHISHFVMRLDPERALRLRRQLGEIFSELAAEGNSQAPDAVEVTAFNLLYSPAPAGPTASPTTAG